MGVVYKAIDSLLNRTVAIKVMNDAIARQEELRARFLREAQAAASLQHPNVVSIYDLGEVDGHLFIAMEYVPGADLEHDRQGRGGAAHAAAEARHRDRRAHGALVRPQARHRAPRHQAGEHPHRRGRPREDHGLRRGAPGVVQADEHRRVAGDAELHGARADHGRQDHAGDGHLRRRRRALRTAHRRAAVRRRLAPESLLQDPHRRAARAPRAHARTADGARAHRGEGDDEGQRGALPERARHGERSERRACRVERAGASDDGVAERHGGARDPALAPDGGGEAHEESRARGRRCARADRPRRARGVTARTDAIPEHDDDGGAARLASTAPSTVGGGVARCGRAAADDCVTTACAGAIRARHRRPRCSKRR